MYVQFISFLLKHNKLTKKGTKKKEESYLPNYSLEFLLIIWLKAHCIKKKEDVKRSMLEHRTTQEPKYIVLNISDFFIDIERRNTGG